jgi:hypothetical protein
MPMHARYNNCPCIIYTESVPAVGEHRELPTDSTHCLVCDDEHVEDTHSVVTASMLPQTFQEIRLHL